MALYNRHEELGCYEGGTNYLISLKFDALPEDIKNLLAQIGFKVWHQPSWHLDLDFHVNGSSIRIPNYGTYEVIVPLDPKAQLQDEDCLNLEEVYPQIIKFLNNKVTKNYNIKAVKEFFAGSPGCSVYERNEYIDVFYGKKCLEVGFFDIDFAQLQWIKEEGAKFAQLRKQAEILRLNDVVIPLFDSLPSDLKEFFSVDVERISIRSSDDFAQVIGYKKGTYTIESQSELNRIVKDWEISKLKKSNKPIPRKLR
jgi:hypothetical protein